MQYFDIATIRQSIERLQNYSANWLLPAFVFAANDVGTDALVDMSKRLGTDQFLDRYFNGKRLNLPPMKHGNNLLRPRKAMETAMAIMAVIRGLLINWIAPGIALLLLATVCLGFFILLAAEIENRPKTAKKAADRTTK